MNNAVPELAGQAEAAAILGVSTTRVRKLTERGDLVPVQVLKCGPIFLADDLRAYTPRPTGRPRRETPASGTRNSAARPAAAGPSGEAAGESD